MSGDSTHRKITNGYVVQVYAGVKCTAQVFVAGNPVDYLDMDDVSLPPDELEHYSKYEIYQPFDMVQPESVDKLLTKQDKKSRRSRFIVALQNRLDREPTEDEIDNMMEEYMDYLEDFQDECDVPGIQAAFIKEMKTNENV